MRPNFAHCSAYTGLRFGLGSPRANMLASYASYLLRICDDGKIFTARQPAYWTFADCEAWSGHTLRAPQSVNLSSRESGPSSLLS